MYRHIAVEQGWRT